MKKMEIFIRSGGFADDAVVEVKNKRDQGKAEKNSPELYAPKAFYVLDEKALRGGVNEHWSKKSFMCSYVDSFTPENGAVSTESVHS